MAVCLALNGASRRAGVWLLQDGLILTGESAEAERGQAQWLATAAQRVLTSAPPFDLIAAIVGPGSFTGIRAALALAHGLALGSARPVVGVTVGEAITEQTAIPPGRTLWVATDSRRGRVFLEHDGIAEAHALDSLPTPDGPVCIAGEQAIAVAAALAARDVDVQLMDARGPDAQGIQRAALRRLKGHLPPRDAQPLYIDPPEARLPATGTRPPPAC